MCECARLLHSSQLPTEAWCAKEGFLLSIAVRTRSGPWDHAPGGIVGTIVFPRRVQRLQILFPWSPSGDCHAEAPRAVPVKDQRPARAHMDMVILCSR